MDKPLKWHKFLIYCLLWFSAFFTAWKGVLVLVGMYQEMQDSLYVSLLSLRILNITYGVLMILLAAYFIYVRFQLAKFKKGAPQKLSSVFVWGFVLEVGYLVLTSFFSDKYMLLRYSLWQILENLIGVLLLCFLNKEYYYNRRELFVN